MNYPSIFALLIFSCLGAGSCYTITEILSDYQDKNHNIYVDFAAPYQVFIKVADRYRCGGALVTYQHVLTTDSCTEYDWNNLTVVAGSQERKIAFVFSKPNEDFEDSIAVIKLERPFTPSELISTMVLPNQPIKHYEHVTVIRRISANQLSTEESPLMFFSSVVVNHTECSKLLNEKIYPGVICDVPLRGTKFCNGVNGNPIVNHYNEVVGIAVDTFKCSENQPNKYFDIEYYLNTIIERIRR